MTTENGHRRACSYPRSIDLKAQDGRLMKQVTRTQNATIQNLATQLVSLALKYHVIPWQNPIRLDSENCGLPLDVATQEPFNPVSTLLLQVAAQRKSFSGRWWGTADAWKELGGLVRHDEQSTWIAVAEISEAYVFNIDQVDGEDVDQFRAVDANVVELGKEDRSLIRQAIVNMRGKESASLPEDLFGVINELAQWADLKVCKEANRPLREMAKQICFGWLATECRVSSLCESCADDDIEVWLDEMRHDPSWIFRTGERARRMVEMVLKI